MPEQSKDLWAPWRMEYIRASNGPANPDACFLCDYAAAPDSDGRNHVLWRTSGCLTLFNGFPYSNGHLLVAPLQHAALLHDLADDVLLELMHQTRDAQRLLAETTSAQGFNVGLNFGRCAGAGLPGHLHVHIVPRWPGDTNYMTTVSGVRVIPEDLRETYRLVKNAWPR